MTLSACASYGYFISGNDLRNQHCTIFLRNGTTIEGSLTIQFETGRLVDRQLNLKTADGQTQKILIDSVSYFSYKDDLYFPKEIDFGAYIIPYREKVNLPNERNLVFLKLITPRDHRLELYELFQSRSKSAEGTDHRYYFAALPGQDRIKAWSIGSNYFLPHFDEKMSAIVSDCPDLARKIKQQEKGYSISQLSVDLKKLEVFQRIVAEYHSCR